MNFYGLPIKERATFHGSGASNFLLFLLIGTFGSIPARMFNTHVNVMAIAAGGVLRALRF
jgi:hypothetical protein